MTARHTDNKITRIPLPNGNAIVGPGSAGCPDCGFEAIQFLVGRGAYCLGCGLLRAAVEPGSNWVTGPLRSEKAEPGNERLDPRKLTNMAIDDAMSGRTRLR